MAVAKIKDGRWICYWRDRQTKKLIRKYFGRGYGAEAAAKKFHNSLGLLPSRRHVGYDGPANTLPSPKKMKCRSDQEYYKLYESMRAQDTGRDVKFEVFTEMGVIDVLYQDEIVEIKPTSVWHHGYGQLIAYGSTMPQKTLRLFLFGDLSVGKLRRIKKHCEDADIKLTICGDILGGQGRRKKAEDRIFIPQELRGRFA